MSAEVAGQAEGVTLLEAIEGGDVPYPERMSYVAWLKWRRETGSRPLSKRDGVSTTPEQEAALWRKVMKFLHDAEDEDEDEEEEEEDSELVPEASGAGGDSPPRVDVSAAARELAMVPTGAAYVPATALGSRPAGPSGPPSTAGSVPGTAEGLQAELRAIFRPDQEPVADYLTRVSRIVLALKAHGVTVSSRDLDALSTKATLLADEFSKIGGDWHPTKMVRRLRTRFSVAALRGGEDPEDAEEIQREIQCIGELILALGGKESSSQGKVWSSPSDVPVEAVGPRSPGLPQPATASGLGVGLDRGGLHTAEVAGGPSAARVLGATDGDSPLRAKLAALEMEIEALKRGSDGGGSQTGSQHPAGDFAAALAAQTEALKEALAQRGGQSSITTVKTDLTWPTLTDDKSDARDVVLFYEEFEDVCALANNCRGMSAREKLLALRGRCCGSRMKTYTNAYRAAWKSGEVLSDPQAVYDRIKNKHLMFGESREEREVRVDGEHASLAKGKLTGHQFEPLFEASIADLEAVGLGKTPRELYLSYLRKMPPYLQKEIRNDKRLWPGDPKDGGLRGPQTWEESHKVVLEYEQREAAHRAVSHSVYTATGSQSADPAVALAEAQKEIRSLKAAAKAAAKGAAAAAKAGADQTYAAASKGAGKGADKKICFHFRDHGNCPKGDACPYSHDKELRRKALAAKKGDQTFATAKGKGKGKGGGKAKANAKPKAAAKGAAKPPGTVCPFFSKNGSCKKGASCDMVHNLTTSGGTPALPANWAPPSGASMSNPFAAFSVQIGSSGVQAGVLGAAGHAAVQQHALPLSKGGRDKFATLDDLPKDWWNLADNEPGGYQYRTVVQVLDRKVECMLDGCAGANHVTEELVVGMMNRAAELGIGTEDPGFPVVRLEKWVHPEYVHGIASGAPVPLKGAAVLRVTLLEGRTADDCRPNTEIFVRCKIAARGTSDWHGLILGGRALDCAGRMGLGFRPGPDFHVLDTLGIRMPRCEDHSRTRKDRAYAFEARLSCLDDASCTEPGGGSRELLRYDGEEPLELSPGDGVLVPVVREAGVSAEGSLSEVVLPVECGVEAVPGLWPTGEGKGFVLLAAQECDHSLQPGEVVAEVRSGLVCTAACGCGAIETVFESEPSPQACADCGVAVASVDHDPCFACGSASRAAARSFQGCSSCARSFGRLRTGARIGVLSVLAAVTVLASVWGGSGPVGRPVEEPGVLTCLDHLPSVDSWWEAPGGYASVWGRRPAQKDLGTVAVEKAPYETCLLQRAGEAWRLWDTRDLRVAESVACSDEVPVTERLAVFRTRKGPRWAGWREGSATAGRGASDAVRPADAVDTARCPSYHIVESWDIDKMIEEPPTDYYYEQLAADMCARHPKACPHLLDHLVSLEGFLDKSILFGFSFGISKAEVCVSKSKLLGHNIGRDGSSPDEERCQAVIDFPPLWEKLHIQQFLGCANWLRGYLPVEYGHAAKILGQWQKPGAVFPEGGLGSAATEGCKAFKAIKRMMQNRINLATFDEASAADGSCPLEQIADASGIAVGGSVVQMTRDLSQLKVLMTHSKSLTPAQQNWPPLIQEAFAQLEVKRATRRMFGSIRTLCWTDHANLTRAQTSDIGMDPKLVRWVAEILMDGSEIRSLSGRSATLGDSFSRNPKDRDALLAARTKDLEGLSGQLRGFDLDQYLGEGTEGDGPVPCAVGNDAVPEPAGRVQAAAVPMCVVAALPVRVMVVFDYARWKEQDAELTEIRRVFQASLPGVSVAVRGCWGPFEDTGLPRILIAGPAGSQGPRRSSGSGSTCLLRVPRFLGKPRGFVRNSS